MLGQGNFQEEILKTYVQKVFQKYDTDKSGTLDQSEMTVFFNQLFKSLGISKSVTPQESMEAIKTIDKNFDGSVNKQQLFLAFKAMLAKSQMQQMQPPPYYGQQPVYPQYGYGNYGGGYYPPPQGNPYNPYQNYGNYPPPTQQPYGYPQSPYYQSQPPMQANQPPMYGSNQPIYQSNTQNPNMMYSQTQQQNGNNNPNPYLSNTTNPYRK